MKMITLNHIQSLQFQQEMLKANISSQDGLSGRSRVCARRAAVILFRAWLDSREITYPNVDGYRLLLLALENEHFPQDSKEILNHLVQRVDKNYNIPDGINLFDEVNLLLEHLSIKLDYE